MLDSVKQRVLGYKLLMFYLQMQEAGCYLSVDELISLLERNRIKTRAAELDPKPVEAAVVEPETPSERSSFSGKRR